ncbi:MAG: NADH-quinone oxidoreductase subunit H [Methanospirillaceae archaeon]|nr:NADH-quinone oxidoreductase subunit H [Methanospirillaceae archaeon]
MHILYGVSFILFGPLIGGIIVGLDRKLTARMQGRVGPPVLQPFYDIGKLFQKERIAVIYSENFWVIAYLIFIVATGMIFFAGGDLLLVIFALTLAHVFLIIGAFSSSSPYAHVGAQRELIQLMAIEPMVILTAVGMYQVTGSFFVIDILAYGGLLIFVLPGVFVGFLYVLTFKLRKSPFDLATSHHAHQELVKGLTTEFAGPTLGIYELAHLYETVMLLGFVYLFFGANPLTGIIAVILVYIIEIFVDNATTRITWQPALISAWIVTIVLGGLNLIGLYLL